MADIRSLERTLAENVTWNKARRNFLAKFVVALVQVKTVSLVQISAVMSGRAKQDSHYKRCQRFLRFFDLPFAEIARLVIKLLGIPKPFIISIDRTDWYLGDTPLNIFMLSVVYNGGAFPLLWIVLEKKGCSDTRERIELLEKYAQLFGKDSIDFVTADREFIGRDWFAYLRRERLPFRIRIKENLKVTNARGTKLVSAKNLFRTEKAGVGRLLVGQRRVLGEAVSLMGLRTCEGEYVIVASSDETQEILSDYRQHWKIETLFGCLKTRGFCLEETHITEKQRLEKLLALLTVAFCWAYLAGEWLARTNPIRIKKHGRLAKSIFRHGFDYLRRILCNQDCVRKRSDFIRLCNLLSCT
ncbi:MAG: IS4 family transposase [Pyrinomonadaceae bacterium MAG19_C2-C3]|nr:IS4 family transposase [Pyrinomonadaceae bacterium MAG19_C2-C3]